MARDSGDWSSAVVSAVALLSIFIAAAAAVVGGVVLLLAIVGGAGYFAQKLWKKWRAPRPPTSSPFAVPPAAARRPQAADDSEGWRDFAFPSTPKRRDDDGEVDPLARWRAQVVEETRQRSLSAMRKSSKARTLDKSRRGEVDARRLGYESRERAPRAKALRGADRDVIRFDYANAQGEYSSRRVRVEWVGEWKFDGTDLDKGAERSFRYDSIIGDITSDSTGEILAPLDWRDSIR